MQPWELRDFLQEQALMNYFTGGFSSGSAVWFKIAFLLAFLGIYVFKPDRVGNYVLARMAMVLFALSVFVTSVGRLALMGDQLLASAPRRGGNIAEASMTIMGLFSCADPILFGIAILLGFLALRRPEATWRGHGPEIKG